MYYINYSLSTRFNTLFDPFIYEVRMGKLSPAWIIRSMLLDPAAHTASCSVQRIPNAMLQAGNQWNVHIHNTGCFCGNLEKDGCSKGIYGAFPLLSLPHDGYHLQSYGSYDHPRQSLLRLSRGSKIQNNPICSMYGILTYQFTIKFNHPCN